MPRSDSSAPFLHIDLKALSHNYRSLQTLIDPTCTLGCVLKSNGYGLGAHTIGEHLLTLGAKQFFVARSDEGISLRKHFKKLSPLSHPQPAIFILNGVSLEYHKEIIAADLIPIFSNTEDLASWNQTASSLQRSLPYGLQVDTGFYRLGLNSKEVDTIGDNPNLFQTESCICIMSHLANGEDPLAPSNAEQKKIFDTTHFKFPKALRSFSHSGGVFLSPFYHYHIIRAGIALYGIQIPHNFKPLFKPVASLKAHLIEINEAHAGARIGYGSTYGMHQGGRVGVLNVGYGDGYPWSLSSTSLKIKGHTVPIAGRISMDLLTLDLSHVPSDLLKKGDTVELIGAENSWEEVAQKASLIPHVLLSQMGSRLQRRYEA